MTYISIVHDATAGKKHITVDKDGAIRHYVVNDTVLDALITHTMFPGSQLREDTEETEKTENAVQRGKSKEKRGKGKGKDGNHR